MWEPIWQWVSEPDNQIVWLGVAAVFLLGLVLTRLSRRDKRRSEEPSDREGEKAFLKGVRHILSDDLDQAIEELTKSVQINSDTVETYVALGNLYRSKGDIGRAIRIRQSIILRPNVDEEIRIRALFDLGLDYTKGGFLDRALETFLEVLKEQPSNLEALENIERIYEELKDWENAFSTRQKIARLVKGDYSHILAHHQTEKGKSFQERGELSKAKSSFKKAISISEGCVDAYLHLGDLYSAKKDYRKAISTWKRVVSVAPRYAFLAYRRLEGVYSQMKDLKPVEVFLRESAEVASDPFAHLALARCLHHEQDYENALKELESALELDPSFLEAGKLAGTILLDQGREKEAAALYRELIEQLNMPYLKFQCANCGLVPTGLKWQCPQCRKWDTITPVDTGKADAGAPLETQNPIPQLPSEPAGEEP